MTRAAHTQIPNLVCDVIAPLLPPPERDCLLYIVRRTVGFVDPNRPGERRKRDTIALQQFERGVYANDCMLDLGVQRTRKTIKAALQELEKKGIVDVLHSCLRCGWEGEIDEDNRQKKACPRCNASLTGSYALAELRPSTVTAFLNKYDKEERQWSWDKKIRRFRFVSPSSEEKKEQARKSAEDMREEIIRIRGLLWYPELIDQFVKRAKAQNKSNQMALKTILESFYKKAWDLQQKYPNPPLIEYALGQTLKAGVLDRKKATTWDRYCARVLSNNKHKFEGGQSGSDAGDIESRERAMYKLLTRAAQLNATGKRDEARAMLSDIIAESGNLAPLFDGDAARCEQQLRLAFKQGSSEFVDLAADPYAPDYYPEWSPGDSQTRSGSEPAMADSARED